MTNILNFDFNLIRVLDALLKERSTVRAAERLGLSQPAVSAALGRLRDSLGDQLFFRRGQGLEPTVYALSLAETVDKLMLSIDSVIHGPSEFDPLRSNARFRLSGSDYFAELLMPPLAEQLEVEAPGMRVHLVNLIPDGVREMFDRYEIDLAFLPRMALPDWIESRLLLRSSFMAIARKDHPRLKRAGIKPGSIIPIDLYCDMGHVIFSTEGNSSAMGDAALERVGRERRVVMTLPVFSGVYRAVAGSDLIALLPTALAKHIAFTAGLDVFKVPMPINDADLMMIWHRRHSADPAHGWMRKKAVEIMKVHDESS